MIGAKYLPNAVAESYYYSYLSKFNETEKRRRLARTLVPGNNSQDIVWQYPTRTILTAQWNDTCKQGLETAKVLYSFEPTLSYYVGQSVLKLTGITASEIKDIKNGEIPKYGFSIDVGIADNNTYPEYGFRSTPDRLKPSSIDPQSILLDYQVSLPVASGVSIDVTSDGKVEINEPLKDRSDFVIYSGRVSLERDTELYSQTRHSEVGNLAFGNGRSFGIVYELLKATGGSELEAFQDLFGQHEISPSHTLSALGSIAL